MKPVVEAQASASAAEPETANQVDENSPPPASDGSWKVGDFCRAVYSEDGVEYEGKVTSSGESEGHQYFVVQFLGYGNEESVWLDGMLPSKGPEERKAQLAACGVEEQPEDCPVVTEEGSKTVPEPVKEPARACQ